MKHTINSTLFFFNTDTDYLPYYKSYSETIDDTLTLKDLLKAISHTITNYTITSNVSINDTLVHDSLSIKTLVEKFGIELKIEPVSIYRAKKDLEINNSDFMEKFKLLEYYCMDGDKAYYESLSNVYYASSSLKHNQDFYGEPLFMLAHKIIMRNATHQLAILNIINHETNGISGYEFDNNVFPAVKVSEIVTQLQEILAEIPSFENTLHNIKDKIKTKITKKSTQTKTDLQKVSQVNFSNLELKNSFKDFNVAFYQGPKPSESYSDLLEFTQAKEISFAAQNKASGVNIAHKLSDVAFSKGAEIIVDAFDNSADILVVEDEAQRVHLSSRENRKASNREIDIQIITSSQLLEIALGNTDKVTLGLDKADIRFI